MCCEIKIAMDALNNSVCFKEDISLVLEPTMSENCQSHHPLNNEQKTNDMHHLKRKLAKTAQYHIAHSFLFTSA